MGERPRIRIKDYQFAEKNGISIERVRQRVHQGWSVERAITMPLQKSDVFGWQKWKEVAAAHGVGYSTYQTRVDVLEWDQEKAATTPPAKRDWKPNPLWVKWKDIAREYGVTRDAFNHRTRNMGWSHEKAATTPPTRKGKVKVL